MATSFICTSTQDPIYPPRSTYSKTIPSKAIAAICCASPIGVRAAIVMLPFSLRSELNGRLLQEEQIKSVRNNIPLGAEFIYHRRKSAIKKPTLNPSRRNGLLRRVAGNVSYQDFGRPPAVEWHPLANGIHKIQGVGHATIVVEMSDHLIAVEGPLYEAAHRARGAIDQRQISQQTDSLRRSRRIITSIMPAASAPSWPPARRRRPVLRERILPPRRH